MLDGNTFNTDKKRESRNLKETKIIQTEKDSYFEKGRYFKGHKGVYKGINTVRNILFSCLLEN